MATHSSVLAQKIPWTEEPGGLQSMGGHRVGRNLATEHNAHQISTKISALNSCYKSHLWSNKLEQFKVTLSTTSYFTPK